MSIKLYNKEIGNIKIYLKEKKSQKKKLFGFLNVSNINLYISRNICN